MRSDEQYVEFVHARASALLRTACLLTAGDRSAAEHLVYTALSRAHTRRRPTRTPAATEAYIRRILVRTAVRRRPDPKQHLDVEGEPTRDGGPDEHLADRLTILDELRALPARQRAAVVLSYHDDLSDAQIAEAIGHSPETVGSHRSRALDALRQVEHHVEPSHQAEEPPLEEYLRSSMEAATDQVRVDHAFVALVLEEGQRRRRQRRTWWLAGGVAVMVAIVSASLVSVDGSDDDSLPEPEPVPQVIDISPIVWARQLPQGPPTRLAYVVGNILHAGDQQIPLPGSAGEVIGTVPVGWLVAVQGHVEPRKGGLPVDTAYGIVTPDGTFQRLPPDPYGGSGEVRALSPDGDLFATGGALVDIASRRVVGRTPEGATYASEWTPTGLLYEMEADGSSWLWRPGSRPIQLPAAVWEAAAAAPRGLAASADGCAEVVDLRADGGVITMFEGCAADQPVSLSPSGTYTLTADSSYATRTS